LTALRMEYQKSLEDRLRTAGQRAWPWFAAIAVLLACQIRWWWDPGPDASEYLSMARHFSHGEVLRFGTVHLGHPPGYPLLIAPFFWVQDRPFLLISLFHWALGLGAAVGIFSWLRRLGIPASGPLTALVMANASFLEVHRHVLSETAFMVELIGTTHVFYRVINSRTLARTAGWIALAVVLLVFTCYTRHLGVFLAAGFVVTLFLRAWRGKDSRRRAMAISVATGLPVVLALLALLAWDQGRLMQMDHTSRPSIESLVDDDYPLWQQVAEGIRRESSECGRLLLPGMYKAYAKAGDWLNINTFIYGVVTVLLAMGWWRLVRHYEDPLLLMCPIYMAFVAFIPWDAGTRYLVPILPVLWASAWPILERRRRPWTILCVLLVAHTAVSLGYWGWELRNVRLHRDWSTLAEVTAPLDSEKDRAELYRVSLPLELMFRVQTDRYLVNYQQPEEIAVATRWLITADREPAPPGFREERVVRQFKVLVRK
jgi:hypothetical protein